MNFPACYGTRRFMTVLTRPRHWSLCWATWIQSTPSQPVSQTSNPVLSSGPRLVLPGGLFPSVFPIKILYAFLIWWSNQIMKLLIMQSSQASRHFLPLRSKYSRQYPVFSQGAEENYKWKWSISGKWRWSCQTVLTIWLFGLFLIWNWIPKVMKGNKLKNNTKHGQSL
jgi:hypothetical protein